MFRAAAKAVSGVVLCLALAGPTATAQSGAWTKQPAGTMAWLHSVFFIDENHGWAAGSKGTLLQTEDGGRTWKATSASTDDVVRDIFFLDPQNGWLVCEVNQYQLKTNEDPRAYLMKTTDGGEKWTRVEIKGFDVDAILVRAVFSRNGRGCVRRHVVCCSAELLSTTIAAGLSARAQQLFRLPMAATPGINRPYRA